MSFEDVMNLSIKYLLIIFNILFVITGIIFISVGSTVQGKYDGYLPFLDDGYKSVPAFLIAIGIIIFIVAVFGICGALKQNYYMTLIFTIFLILIFILELSAGISGYVLRNRAEAVFNNNLHTSIQKYYEKDELSMGTWDDIQRNLGCCGISNHSDWIYKDKMEIPMSCCVIPPGTVSQYSCNNETVSNTTSGCFAPAIGFIKSHAGSLGAAGICIAVAQFIGILFACHLTKKAKNDMVFT